MKHIAFGQCFDTVDLVIWPVKIVPEMTHVLSRTLNLYTATTTLWRWLGRPLAALRYRSAESNVYECLVVKVTVRGVCWCA